MLLSSRRIAVVLTSALALAAASIPTMAEANGFFFGPGSFGPGLFGAGGWGRGAWGRRPRLGRRLERLRLRSSLGAAAVRLGLLVSQG